MSNSMPNGLKRAGNILLFGVLPLLIGWWIAPRFVPVPAVGLIRLETDLWAGSAEFVNIQIQEAKEDKRIKAVVVLIDSPGGEVTPTQTLYLELLKLREQMPVVGSVGSVAASGGFYVAMASDPIFAKPSSIIGNVGVWSFAPATIGVNEEILASGPFKLTASNQDSFLRKIEGVKQEFLATVFAHRGERINISEADLSLGLAYPGREALQLGLIDRLGGRSEAISHAAELAGLADYDVIDLSLQAFESLGLNGFAKGTRWIGTANPATGHRTLPPGAYLLYDEKIGGRP
jgi:protease-4